MKVLLDTHTIFWAVSIPEKHKLSSKVLTIIEGSSNELIISGISLFEFTIKYSLNKLSYNGGLEKLYNDINKLGAQVIYPQNEDYIAYSQLPFHHRDPFDRLIIAQSISHNIPVLTKDGHFKNYNIQVIW